MFSFDTQVRVRYADTDQMQVVYHAKYIEYFEVGRTDAMRSLGITYKDVEQAGIIMPVVSVDCKFIKPALYDDLLTIRTSLLHLPKDHKIEFHQEVYNEKNHLLCKGKVVLYFMEKITFQKTGMPLMLTSKLDSFFNQSI
jgi:acyl-CoA thioester hydrolase